MGIRKGPLEDLAVKRWAKTFYSGKRVLVTGHTGFKGGWLAHWLKTLGADVAGYSLPPEASPNLFEAGAVARGVTSVLGDVRDLAALSQLVADHRPEVVFHLAAQALVRRSYREPVETFATNVMGTVNLLEACRRAGSPRAVVVVTSDKCYENREWVWGYREQDALGGFDPYSSSKACAELATAAYRRSFFEAETGVGIATARAGNVIGGGDWAEDRLVPDLVRARVSGTPVVIRNPTSTRPWQHVLEPLAGYLLLAQKLWEDPAPHSGPWNFGPDAGESVPVIEVARVFARELGVALETPEQEAVHEARSLKLDSSRAKLLLGWKPRLTLDESLTLTARWYRAYLDDSASAPRMLDEQIEHYSGLGE